MAVAIGNGAAGEMGVDATPKAGRVILYDAAGNIITPANRAAILDTAAGIINVGKDYKIARAIRSSPDGTMRTSDDTLLLYDSVEGAAFDSNKWIQTLTTMTVTQATGSILFNAGSSVAATVGAMHVSHRMFPFIHRNALAFRTRVLSTAHFANNQIQLGFGTPTAVTAVAFLNGAAWRKDGSGQWVPVISINGAETLGTPISDATFRASVPTTDYAIFSVFLEETRATFQIQTSLGVLVNAQVIDFTAASTTFAATHLPAMHHICNTGATGTAVQMRVSGTTIMACDALSQIDFKTIQSGMQLNSLTSPTAYTQLANSVNNTTPTSRTLVNTAAGETTLGGALVATAMVAATTDLIMFGFQVPTPYQFYFTSIRIGVPINQVVAVATTETLFEYGMAFNSSAVSLATAAPYNPMRVMLTGFHRAAVALGVNQVFTTGTEIVWQPQTPMVVQPSRFLHVFLRCLVGTATATETYRWQVNIEGYFV